jgi:hypothetical protein
MNKQKLLMLVINLIGGIAVVASYVLGLGAHPGQTEALWGGVPVSIRPFYTGNMLLAATGYLFLLYFLLVRLDPAVRIGKLSWWAFNLLYILILAPSALWMSLTFAVAEQYTLMRWLSVVVTLALVGLGSSGMLLALLKLRPRPQGGAYWLAVAGAFFLFLQTGVLDAIVWISYYLK